MSIETVGSFKSMLDGYSTDKWVKKADIGIENPMKGLEELGFDELSSPDKGKSFTELLASSISQVNDLQKEANMAMQKLATGKTKNIHETMIAVERAELAFKTMNQVRTKVIDAYREIMKMQV